MQHAHIKSSVSLWRNSYSLYSAVDHLMSIISKRCHPSKPERRNRHASDVRNIMQKKYLCGRIWEIGEVTPTSRVGIVLRKIYPQRRISHTESSGPRLNKPQSALCIICPAHVSDGQGAGLARHLCIPGIGSPAPDMSLLL